MYRIDNASAVDTVPPSTVLGKAEGYFSGGNPGAGVQATRVDAEWLNTMQEEGANLVLSAGLALDKADRTQWSKAVAAMIAGATAPPVDLTGYVLKAGDTMLGFLTANADPQQPLHYATKRYVDAASAGVPPGTFVMVAGDVMTGALQLPRADAFSATATWGAGGQVRWGADNANCWSFSADATGAGILALTDAGTTTPVMEFRGNDVLMLEFLTLDADPVQPMHAATRRYVDGFVLKAGDTMTGTLTLPDLQVHAAWGAGTIQLGPTAADNWSLVTDATGDLFIGKLVAGVTTPVLQFDGTGSIRVAEHLLASGAIRADLGLFPSYALAPEFILAASGGTLNTQYATGWRWAFDQASGSLDWIGSGTGVELNNVTFSETGGVAVRQENLYLNIGFGYQPGAGPWLDVSDERVKQDVVPYTTGLAAIEQINPVEYSFIPETGRDSTRRHVGIIAQQVQPIMPELIAGTLPAGSGRVAFGLDAEMDDVEQLLVYNGNALTYAMVNAIKELAARVTALEA